MCTNLYVYITKHTRAKKQHISTYHSMDIKRVAGRKADRHLAERTQHIQAEQTQYRPNRHDIGRTDTIQAEKKLQSPNRHYIGRIDTIQAEQTLYRPKRNYRAGTDTKHRPNSHYIIIIIKKGRQCKAEREYVIYTISVRKHQPHNTNLQTGKREKEKQQKTIVGIEQLKPIKRISPAPETRQSHTIEYRVSKIVPERH